MGEEFCELLILLEWVSRIPCAHGVHVSAWPHAHQNLEQTECLIM